MVAQIIVRPCPANQPNLPRGAKKTTAPVGLHRQPSWNSLKVTTPIFGERYELGEAKTMMSIKDWGGILQDACSAIGYREMFRRGIVM